MRILLLTLISTLILTTSCLAVDSQKNFLIQCDNGVEATFNTERLDISGLLLLKFKRVAEQDDNKTIIVYGNDQADTRILIQYAGPKVFLQDRNNWVPCDIYRTDS